MADITMCQGISSDNIGCDKREQCYRHTAVPNEFRQSYFMGAPLVIVVNDSGWSQECDYFKSNV
jgi:hypothetical protein